MTHVEYAYARIGRAREREKEREKVIDVVIVIAAHGQPLHFTAAACTVAAVLVDSQACCSSAFVAAAAVAVVADVVVAAAELPKMPPLLDRERVSASIMGWSRIDSMVTHLSGLLLDPDTLNGNARGKVWMSERLIGADSLRRVEFQELFQQIDGCRRCLR